MQELAPQHSESGKFKFKHALAIDLSQCTRHSSNETHKRLIERSQI